MLANNRETKTFESKQSLSSLLPLKLDPLGNAFKRCEKYFNLNYSFNFQFRSTIYYQAIGAYVYEH